jgi:AcrR family transcriptional regulator
MSAVAPPKTKTPAEGGDKRAAIMQAALELFAERGFHGTAVPEIAERARVGAGTIYRYFESKEALVNALYRMHKVAMSEAFDFGNVDPTAPARVMFHHFWTRAWTFAREKPLVLEFLELHHHAPYLDQESRALEQGILELAHSLIAAAQAKQALKPLDPPVMLAIVWGAFRGLVQGGCDGRIKLTDAILTQAEQTVWEAVRA